MITNLIANVQVQTSCSTVVTTPAIAFDNYELCISVHSTCVFPAILITHVDYFCDSINNQPIAEIKNIVFTLE